MEGERKQPVQVACSIPNGIALQLVADPIEPYTGKRRVGPQVVLRGPRSPLSDFSPGEEITEVDPEFWAEWLRQNEKNPLVVERHIHAVEREGER